MEKRIADLLEDIKAKVAGAQVELANGRMVPADRLLNMVNSDVASVIRIFGELNGNGKQAR